MELAVRLDSSSRAVLPGTRLAGHMVWDLQGKTAERLELRLYWRTEGRGTRDVGVAQRVEVASPATRGQREFVLDLPPGPYSFSGKLVSLIWAVELVALPSEDASLPIELYLSPTGAAIDLATLAPIPHD